MLKGKIRMLATIFTCLLLLFACSDNNEEPVSKTKKSQASAPTSPEPAKELTPAQLGEKAGDIYVKAMTDLTETLKDKPPATEVEGKINALKENTIKQLVEIGHKREAMEAGDRSSMNMKLRSKVNSLYSSPVWKAYSDLSNHYRGDKSLHATILSFNIMTQYADFELLKKQAPKEATRLGIQ